MWVKWKFFPLPPFYLEHHFQVGSYLNPGDVTIANSLLLLPSFLHSENAGAFSFFLFPFSCCKTQLDPTELRWSNEIYLFIATHKDQLIPLNSTWNPDGTRWDTFPKYQIIPPPHASAMYSSHIFKEIFLPQIRQGDWPVPKTWRWWTPPCDWRPTHNETKTPWSYGHMDNVGNLTSFDTFLLHGCPWSFLNVDKSEYFCKLSICT